MLIVVSEIECSSSLVCKYKEIQYKERCISLKQYLIGSIVKTPFKFEIVGTQIHFVH
jgi:hypothetical protein